MRFIGIIPARYASVRFPGKPLVMLGGKTVIQRVYERICESLQEVFVATDDERIEKVVRDFGGNVIMTSPTHPSGTDRVCEAAKKVLQSEKVGEDVVIINVQGDEPFIATSQIKSLCRCFDDEATQIATLAKPITDKQIPFNPNSPKVVIDNNGFALYFSRSPIPYNREDPSLSEGVNSGVYNKHIGIYAYRFSVLQEITKLPQSSLEMTEKLEQLRWLQNGYKIKVALTDIETIGIDVPEDLAKAEKYLANCQS